MDSRRFFYDFGKALYHIDAIYEDFARQSGAASPTLLWILYALNDGNEHTQREICSAWDLPKSTVNTVVSELKQNGHVTLTPIKGKRREMTVTLTEQGRAYAASLLAEVYKKEAAAFAMLTDDERSVTAHLEKIAACLRGEAAK